MTYAIRNDVHFSVSLFKKTSSIFYGLLGQVRKQSRRHKGLPVRFLNLPEALFAKYTIRFDLKSHPRLGF